MIDNHDTRTLAHLAQEALDIQNACNLSGLVFGWARAMKRFNQLLPGIGTDARNKHPIHVLWADKFHDLTGGAYVYPDNVVFAAEKECRRLASVATETTAVEKEVVPELLRLADDGCPNVPSPPLPPTGNP